MPKKYKEDYLEDPNDPRPRHNLGSAALQYFGVRGNRQNAIDAWEQRRQFLNAQKLQKNQFANNRSNAELQQEFLSRRQDFQGGALRQFNKYLDLGIDYNDLPPAFLASVTEQLGGPRQVREYASEYKGMPAELKARQDMATQAAEMATKDLPRSYQNKAEMDKANLAAANRFNVGPDVVERDTGRVYNAAKESRYQPKEVQDSIVIKRQDGTPMTLPGETRRIMEQVEPARPLTVDGLRMPSAIGQIQSDGSFQRSSLQPSARSTNEVGPVGGNAYQGAYPGSLESAMAPQTKGPSPAETKVSPAPATGNKSSFWPDFLRNAVRPQDPNNPNSPTIFDAPKMFKDFFKVPGQPEAVNPPDTNPLPAGTPIQPLPAGMQFDKGPASSNKVSVPGGLRTAGISAPVAPMSSMLSGQYYNPQPVARTMEIQQPTFETEEPVNKYLNYLNDEAPKTSTPKNTKNLGNLGSDLQNAQNVAEAVGLNGVADAVGGVAGGLSEAMGGMTGALGAMGPWGAIAGAVLESAMSDSSSKGGGGVIQQGQSAYNDKAPVMPKREKSLAELAQDLEKGTDRQSQRITTLPTASDMYRELMNQLYIDPKNKIRPAY